MNDSKMYWFFVRKVHERLTIILEHKVRNHMELDDADEELLKEIYEFYSRSDLFSPTDKELAEDTPIDIDIMTDLQGGT